jgi:hypothetical protein
VTSPPAPSFTTSAKLMARLAEVSTARSRTNREEQALTCGFTVERVTGIEPALSAWESVPSGPVTWPDLRRDVSASDRERPLVTGVNGLLMARRSRPRIIVAEKAWSAVAWYAVVRTGML